MAEDSPGQIAKNPSAWRNFHLLETFEAGIELKGSEVKSLRAHHATMRDAFARVDKKQVWLYGLEITPYAQAGNTAPESKRERRLLLHRSQIDKLESQVARKGNTIVATRMYFKGSLVKVEIALATGKQEFDKRETIKKRDEDRHISRILKKRG